MEELQGVSVSAARLRQPQVDGRKLADILLRSALRLMMGGERFHADSTPGTSGCSMMAAWACWISGPPVGSTPWSRPRWPTC